MDIVSVDSAELKPTNKKDLKCAPGTVFDAGSCMSLRVLIEYANAYNASHGTKIKMYPSFESLNPRKYKKYLVKELKTRMGNKCTNQNCWLEQNFINKMKMQEQEELARNTFRPDGPTGKFEWLNTYNIDDVMHQYETKYPDFKFMGAVPIDFDDLPALGIKDLNYKNLVNEGKSKVGFVFNLDEHWQPGSHWVALYADIKKGNIYYFDSYGIEPCPRVRKLMRRIARFAQNEMSISKPVADYNKVRHQYENSECGVYSINFILRLLRGDSFQTICESKTPDRKVNKCRKIYFK